MYKKICKYVYAHVCPCTPTYDLHLAMYISMHAYIQACLSRNIQLYIYVYILNYPCVYKYMHMYTLEFTCMCVYMHTNMQFCPSYVLGALKHELILETIEHANLECKYVLAIKRDPEVGLKMSRCCTKKRM